MLKDDKTCNMNEAEYYIASKEKFKDSNEFCKKIYRTIISNFGYELKYSPDIEEYLPNNKLKLYIPVIK